MIFKKFFLFCALILTVHQPVLFAVISASPIPVEGLTLAQHKISYRTQRLKRVWTLESAHGFMIADTHTPTRHKKIADTKINITIVDGSVLINDTDTKTDAIRIAPVEGAMQYNGKNYEGYCIAAVDDERATLVQYPAVESQTVAIKPIDTKERKNRMHIVRVLLDEKSTDAGELWQLKNAHGFIVSAGDETTQMVSVDKKLSIRWAHDALYINDQKQKKNTVTLVPKKGFIGWDGKKYHGSFTLMRRNEKMLLINNVPLEDYVYCVLKSESWPGWPLEVNKVLAIASRSYVLARIARVSNSMPYDILNTNMHQVYAGMHNSPVHKQAVEETKGMFVSYDNAPIIAMFDSCCGGVIPADIKGINFKEAPYLKRTHACTFCSGCTNYTWRIEMDAATLAKALQVEYPRLRMVRNIRLGQKDKAGLVQTLIVKGKHGQLTVPGHRFRALLPKVKSLCFSIHRSGDTYIINGHGQGHNRGLCQWGAREMVRQGYAYDEILAFYYPKTELVKLA